MENLPLGLVFDQIAVYQISELGVKEKKQVDLFDQMRMMR